MIPENIARLLEKEYTLTIMKLFGGKSNEKYVATIDLYSSKFTLSARGLTADEALNNLSDNIDYDNA